MKTSYLGAILYSILCDRSLGAPYLVGSHSLHPNEQFSRVVDNLLSHQVPCGRPPLPQSTSSHFNTNRISTVASTAPRFRRSSEDLTSLSRGGVVATSDNRPSVFGGCCCGAAVLTASFLPPYCLLSAYQPSPVVTYLEDIHIRYFKYSLEVSTSRMHFKHVL